jgi:exopolyphosphatase/guanosine-5'-triphosphate,3'-diphosphate pyrophosphatase
MSRITAVIDFGSNSVRLVIYERTSRFGFKTIHESKSNVRIGEDAYNRNGYLQPEPIRRAILTLKGFKTIMNSFKVKKILAIATSAVRDAPNQKEFVNIVKKETEINLKVIGGSREALLGGIACANLLQNSNGVTIDIGGGSTEFALIENRQVIATHSLNLGTVRLKELFVNFKTLDSIISFIKHELRSLPDEFKNIDNLIGIGGTIRALSKAIQQQIGYPLDRVHGYTYIYKDQAEFINKLIFADKTMLLEAGFKKDRLDVIQWGLIIFKEIVETLEYKNIITSGAGIREGLLLKDLLKSVKYKFPENFNPSLRNILDDFPAQSEKSAKISSKIAEQLFYALQETFELTNEHLLILRYTSKLLEIGVNVDFYGNTKNGFYMILNRFIYGVSPENAIIVALLVRLSEKASFNQLVIEEYKSLLPTDKIFHALHSIIYLTKLLTINYSNEIEFNINFNKGILIITFNNASLFHMVGEELEELENILVELVDESQS